MEHDDRPRLMSVKETAEVLRCSTKSVYKLLDGGRLTPLRPLSPGSRKGHLRVRSSDVEALINGSREVAIRRGSRAGAASSSGVERPSAPEAA